MSSFTDAWTELYAAQTEATGIAYTATVNLITGPCILSTIALRPKLSLSSFTEDGAVPFQMLASSFPNGEPPAQCAIELQGIPNLYLYDLDVNNGVYYMTAQDRTKK
jgi:hypothetical protein